MSEQKVWVEKMPENCFECSIMADGSEGCDYCVCSILEEKAETKNRLKDCPLLSIKDHDRELVKEVCEKIKRKVDNISMHTATKERLMLMCEEIQKELEDE